MAGKGIINVRRCWNCLGLGDDDTMCLYCPDKDGQLVICGVKNKTEVCECTLHWKRGKPSEDVLKEFRHRFVFEQGKMNRVLSNCCPGKDCACYCDYFVAEANNE